MAPWSPQRRLQNESNLRLDLRMYQLRGLDLTAIDDAHVIEDHAEDRHLRAHLLHLCARGPTDLVPPPLLTASLLVAANLCLNRIRVVPVELGIRIGNLV